MQVIRMYMFKKKWGRGGECPVGKEFFLGSRYMQLVKQERFMWGNSCPDIERTFKGSKENVERGKGTRLMVPPPFHHLRLSSIYAFHNQIPVSDTTSSIITSLPPS